MFYVHRDDGILNHLVIFKVATKTTLVQIYSIIF